jgi:hypothetical protein
MSRPEQAASNVSHREGVRFSMKKSPDSLFEEMYGTLYHIMKEVYMNKSHQSSYLDSNFYRRYFFLIVTIKYVTIATNGMEGNQ